MPSIDFRVALLFLVTVVFASTQQAQSAPASLTPIVGNVEQLSGKVYMKSLGAKKQELLLPGRSLGRPLRRGTVLWIPAGGHILFHVGKRLHDLRGPMLYPIPYPGNMGENFNNAMRASFELGGPERGNNGVLLTPVDDGLARPDHFEIRWAAMPAGTRLQFQLTKNRESRPFWQSWSVPATIRRFSAPEMKRALLVQQNRTDRAFIVLATLVTLPHIKKEAPVHYTVDFHLISRDQQKAIENQLRLSEETTGILKILLRVGVLRRATLSGELTNELEKAHKLYPQSEEFKRQLKAAELAIGNLDE